VSYIEIHVFILLILLYIFFLDNSILKILCIHTVIELILQYPRDNIARYVYLAYFIIYYIIKLIAVNSLYIIYIT